MVEILDLINIELSRGLDAHLQVTKNKKHSYDSFVAAGVLCLYESEKYSLLGREIFPCLDKINEDFKKTEELYQVVRFYHTTLQKEIVSSQEPEEVQEQKLQSAYKSLVAKYEQICRLYDIVDDEFSEFKFRLKHLILINKPEAISSFIEEMKADLEELSQSFSHVLEKAKPVFSDNIPSNGSEEPNQ